MIAFRLLLFICFVVDWPAFSCWASPFYFVVVVVVVVGFLLLLRWHVWIRDCANVCVCSFLSLYLRDLLSTHDNGQYGVCVCWMGCQCVCGHRFYELWCVWIWIFDFKNRVRAIWIDTNSERAAQEEKKRTKKQNQTTNQRRQIQSQNRKKQRQQLIIVHRSFACLLRTLFLPSPSFGRLKAFIYLFRVIYLHNTLRCQPTCVSV